MLGSRFPFALLVALSVGCSLVEDDVATSEGEVNVAPSPFWKSKLTFPNETFAKSDGGGQPRWVKFTIFVSEPTKDGRLTTEDILVTDGVPAEVPYVAAIISLAPSTPSSHVAILSKTWGIPFVFPAAQATRDAIKAHAITGTKELALRTVGGSDVFGGSYCSLEVIEPKGTIDAATRAALADLRKPPPADVPARAHLGALTKKTELLKPADVKYFGGKASNFGTLRRAIPNNSPNALGISFDLWEAFVAQTMPSGKTLAQEVDERLGALAFPPDMGALETKLAGARGEGHPGDRHHRCRAARRR